jgi:ubiquitin-protein ligase
MLTELRWQKEVELMSGVFPQFKPYARCSVDGRECQVDPASACELSEKGTSPFFGFQGRLKGVKSGRVYRVVLEAEPQKYPQCPPNVYLDPMVGHCWIGVSSRRSLCVTRAWRPAQSTFANTLLVVVKYLEEHDGQPDLI